MKLRKSVLVVLFYLVLVSSLVVAFFVGKGKMDASWKDSSTWTTEDKVIIPAEANNLKVKNVIEPTEDPNVKNFSFKADYCYLYEIAMAQDEQSATLRCSLLPMYYVDRAKELPNDWQAKSDILLVVAKTDPEPAEFMGRLDKSFGSVSALGGKKYPVSIEISGKYTYPTDTLNARFSHFLLVLSGKKEKLQTVVSGFSVNKLDAATQEEMHDFSQKWLTDMKKTLSDTFVSNGLTKKEGADFLDTANNQFNHLRVKCLGLNNCHDEYIGNPANNFMYMLFSAEKWNLDLFHQSTKAMNAALYPFNGAASYPMNDGDVVEGKIVHWTVFSAYEFPICPVNDLIRGEKSESFDLLRKYLSKEVVLDPAQLNSSELLKLLSSAPYTAEGLEAELVEFGGWETDRIFAINEGCLRALDGNDATTLALKKQVLTSYYAMLSLFIGTKTDGSPESLEKIIYESNAYSPYSSKFISDFGVARYREQELESNEKAANTYIEWRSALSSYIVMYLYENTR